MDAIRTAGKKIFTTVKGPMTATVISVGTAAAAKYVFERTKLAQDLREAQNKIKTLENENNELVKYNRELAGHNTNYADRCNSLLDELRHANAYISDVKENLNSCQKKVDICDGKSKNTWSLWNNDAYNDCSDRISELDNQPKIAVRAIKK